MRSAAQTASAAISVLVLAATLAGCAQPRPATIPMQQLSDLSGCAAPTAALVVMLPGVYSPPQEFIDEGFVAALRQRGLAVDVTMVDAHLGYFADRTVLQRLRQDVVLPARAAGYRQVWLVGISLGGLAALGYAARHGDDIDGVLAIAPYPGTQALQREIVAAGGPRAWRQCVAEPGADLEREVWWWLAGGDAARRPPVYLGHGQGDRFVTGLELMAGTVPPERAATVPGGHDWAPWRAVWNGWLERGLLPAGCGRAAGG
jgi:pimeloyl-ACP methyl ester carboxylesterase